MTRVVALLVLAAFFARTAVLTGATLFTAALCGLVEVREIAGLGVFTRFLVSALFAFLPAVRTRSALLFLAPTEP